MTTWTLEEIAEGLRGSWAADTCSPDDVERAPWTEENPAWGHCDVTALVLQDLFGGELICAQVHLDGEQQGYHWWNRLSSGVELDLTREQFTLGQVISAPEVVRRDFVRPRPRAEEYELLRERLSRRLGPLPAMGAMAEPPAPA